MKRYTIAAVFLLFCLVFNPSFLNAKSPVPASLGSDSFIKQLLEVQQKRITLKYLADPRSKTFFEDLLKDFPAPLRKNFRANITGAYSKVLADNFDAKINEVSLDLVKFLDRTPAEETAVLTTIESTPFPMDLAFPIIVKKLSDVKSFQMSQAAQADQGALKAESDRLKQLMGKLAAESKKDPYDSVKAMYEKTARRDFPIWWYDDAQHQVGYTTHGEEPTAPAQQKRKKWTALIFLNADNDLEGAGLKDINEMEKIGSDESINIVVQVDRMDGGKGDSITDENWTGTRRYYITRDQSKKITSKMVMNLGERDMGNRKELAEFLTWGIETYPADHILAVVWNHGAGWKGISIDDQSGNMLTTPDLLWAFSQIKPSLEKVNPGHPKIDVLDFDACLMGMVEVAYELKDTVDFLVASEETEPGEGMPYMDTLRPMKDNPAIAPKALAQDMVSAYVKSYAIGGDQTNKVIKGSSVTKSAYDLSKIGPLVDQINKLGSALLSKHDVYSRLLVDAFGQFARIRRYSDTSFVDLMDFAKKLAVLKELPEEARTACIEIIKILGYPKLDDRLAQPIVIKRKTPGTVIWGYNGWKTPPEDMRPAKSQIYHSRFVSTPLAGPDEKGFYTCKIGPFGLVVDPVKRKKEFVTEINYKIEYDNGKTSPDFTDRTGKEYTLFSQFPESSPLIAEGHTQGMGNSFGISIYFPYCLEFRTSYKTLQFSKNTAWDEFIAAIPQYHRNADVLLTGNLVEDVQSLPFFLDTLQKLNIHVDVLWDPRVFAYKFADILEQYKNGIVITDSTSASSFENLAPSADELSEYLNSGGSVLIAAQSIEQRNFNMKLLEEYFKFKYVDDDRDLPPLSLKDAKGQNLKLELKGDDSANTSSDVTIMECDSPANLFIKTEDGRGAAIAINGTSPGGNAYRGVFLGFRFESVNGGANRVALMEKALSLLSPKITTTPAK